MRWQVVSEEIQSAKTTAQPTEGKNIRMPRWAQMKIIIYGKINNMTSY